MRVSVIGLGKLGLCTAACFASRGNSVHGFDTNPATMVKLKVGNCPIQEPGLDGLLASAAGCFVPAKDAREAVEASEITLIIVPTPSEPGGRFSTRFVEAVLRDIAPALKKKERFHVVDVVSTVMPGTSDNIFKPLLEKETGKRCGPDFGLVYNPEFIALGSVIRDFMHPDMVLIGASDARSAETARALYATLFETQPHYALMSLLNAEITKLSLNCFVTMKISFANEIAGLCERIPGADAAAVTAALGKDTRIGSKCLKPGLGFGGPCFPRDNLAFQACCADHGYEAKLGPQVVRVNQCVPERLKARVAATEKQGACIALLGMSYKPGTHIIEESHSVKLARLLLDSGYRVRLYDPKALDECRRLFGDAAGYADDPYECCDGASCAVMLTQWPQVQGLDRGRAAARLSGGARVIDAWSRENGEEYSCR